MTFPARYPGRCAAADCDDAIDPGDIVEYVDEQLVHEGCRPAPTVERAPRPVCPECFTETALNGACACP
ncbi:hypothetical protein [Microbacterium sp. UBA3394]|uniref:hypothetical protein n=1 Tax=Microbacterium sp. UBA3394 TaxID=1946945 RepID=UPI000C436AAD|nr:hypothetical protein [Microbacterium sp. UBA3394]MAM53562.1 hypothetical protein [Microbacterium sp.]|tara:strand:+ start:235 stop:441 length:207 start_codon:yes stop_codon:yes gene_type:complete